MNDYYYILNPPSLSQPGAKISLEIADSLETLFIDSNLKAFPSKTNTGQYLIIFTTKCKIDSPYLTEIAWQTLEDLSGYCRAPNCDCRCLEGFECGKPFFDYLLKNSLIRIQKENEKKIQAQTFNGKHMVILKQDWVYKIGTSENEKSPCPFYEKDNGCQLQNIQKPFSCQRYFCINVWKRKTTENRQKE